MVGIKHSVTTLEANNPAYDVSASAWNSEHNIDNNSIPAQKILNPDEPYSYIIWKDGATYYAKDGHTGAVTSNANASTLIQGLINACAVTVHLHFKIGIYDIPTKITVDKYVRISGESSGHTAVTDGHGVIFKATAALTSVFEVICALAYIPCNGPLFENFMINGNSQASIGILVDNETTRFTCFRVTAAYCTVWGLSDLMNHTHSYYSCQFSRNGANGTNPSGGVQIGDSGNQSNGSAFYNCAIEWNNKYGVLINYTHHVLFSGCVIEGNYDQGVYASAALSTLPYGARFEACYFEDNNQHNAADTGNYLGTNCYYWSLSDCFFAEGLSIGNTTYQLTIVGGYNTVTNPYKGATPLIRMSWYNTYIGLSSFLSNGGGPLRVIITSGQSGFGATTPAVPATTVYVANPNNYTCGVIILTAGTISDYTIKDADGTAQLVSAIPAAGAIIPLGVNFSIRFTYAGAAPTWKWMGL